MSEFSNHRKWREFVTAVHESVTYPCAVTYPKVIGALRSGRDWFNDGAARASGWLSGSGSARSSSHPTISLQRALSLEQIET
jgi:hypothetical protein